MMREDGSYQHHAFKFVDYELKWEKKANRRIECQGTKTSQSDILQNVGKRAKLLHNLQLHSIETIDAFL